MSPELRTPELARRLQDLTLDDSERLRALALAIPTGGAISRRTAASLWGFHVFGHREKGMRLPLECTIPTGSDPVRRPGVTSYTATLRGDVTELHGLPVTTATRTVLDVARWCTPDAAIAMLDRSLAMGLWDPEDVLEQAERFRGEKHIKWARHLARAADPGSESPGESACRLRLVDAGFVRPKTQIRVERGNGRHFRLDMGWLEHLCAVEFDGREPHESLEAAIRDRWRREWLTGQGWRVLPVGGRHVYGKEMDLEYTVAQILGVQPRRSYRLW